MLRSRWQLTTGHSTFRLVSWSAATLAERAAALSPGEAAWQLDVLATATTTAELGWLDELAADDAAPDSLRARPADVLRAAVQTRLREGTLLLLREAVARPALPADLEPVEPDEEPEEVATEVRTWIEVQVVDDDGSPVRDVPVEMTLPNGATWTGKLDGQGRVRLTGLDPGSCKLSFPAPKAA